MLQPKFEMDRDYDLIIKRSVPYLIFTPIEFREKLVSLLEALCHDYLDKNEIAFQSIYLSIKKMLDEASFSDSIELKIHYFLSQQNTIEENFRRINERITKLENNMKSKRNKEIQIEPQHIHNTFTTHSKRNVLLVTDCLKNSVSPLSREEMSVITGLTPDQISKIIFSIKANLKRDQKIKLVNSKFNGKPYSKDLKINVYSWIGPK